jgi:flagellar protein FlaG
MQVNSINSSVDYNSAFPQTAEKTGAPPAKQIPNVSTESKPEAKAEELTKLQNVLEENNVSLNFSRDEKSGEIIVKLVDSATGEAIRQLPTEVSLKLSAANAKLQGQFIDKQG